MQITPEFLAEIRRGLEEQRLKGLGLVNQAMGGMALVDHLAKHLAAAEPAPLSEEELLQAVGADEINVVQMTKPG